jgi:hypothetical protein
MTEEINLDNLPAVHDDYAMDAINVTKDVLENYFKQTTQLPYQTDGLVIDHIEPIPETIIGQEATLEFVNKIDPLNYHSPVQEPEGVVTTVTNPINFDGDFDGDGGDTNHELHREDFEAKDVVPVVNNHIEEQKAVVNVVTNHVKHEDVTELIDGTNREPLMPNIEDLNETARLYMEYMIKPYRDALVPAESIEQLNLWYPLIFQGEHLQKVQKMLKDKLEVEIVKKIILDFMAGHIISLIKVKPKDITPWDLASTRDELSLKLFGEPINSLPVQVTIGPNTYTHMLSEEFTYGLLSVLEGQPSYLISINGTKIRLNDIKYKYDPTTAQGFTYEAIIPSGPSKFYSPDLIQGVMTGAKWINVDPHTLVKDLRGMMNNTMIALTF